MVKYFREEIKVTLTQLPNVDIHRTTYPSNNFDIVAADQVLEHVYFPHLVIMEIRRILKPGGIAIITTCGFNPVHGSGPFYDYWRFMTDGLKTLSLPFSEVLQCGSWGTSKVIEIRARVSIPVIRNLNPFLKNKL